MTDGMYDGEVISSDTSEESLIKQLLGNRYFVEHVYYNQETKTYCVVVRGNVVNILTMRELQEHKFRICGIRSQIDEDKFQIDIIKDYRVDIEKIKEIVYDAKIENFTNSLYVELPSCTKITHDMIMQFQKAKFNIVKLWTYDDIGIRMCVVPFDRLRQYWEEEADKLPSSR